MLGVAGAALASAALALVTAAQGAVGPIAGTSPLAPPLGACLGSQCPATWPPLNSNDFTGRDAAINLFAGTDFAATRRAAEIEGKIVVLNDFTVDKSPGGGVFNVGVAGVGSRVPPPNGTDFLTVGGNVTVATGTAVEVGGVDSKGSAYGDVRYGGTLTGTVRLTPTGQAIHDTSAIDRYKSLRTYIENRSECAATAPATGTVDVSGSQVTFRGDGTSGLQVFTVPGNIGTATSAADFSFTGIPAGASILVNMTGTTPIINTNTGSGIAGDPMAPLRPYLMWNFPNATSATITGGAQFQGSVLGGNPAGHLTVSAPGVNGRIYVAGGVTLTNPGTGVEFHAYPFDGVLPCCENGGPTTTPTTSPTTSATTTTPTTTTPTTTTPTTTPSSSTSPSTSPSTTSPSTPGPTTSTMPTPTSPPLPSTPTGTQPVGPGPRPSGPGGGLAATGGNGLAQAFGFAAVFLAAGAGVLAYATRKKGSHS